MGEAELDSDGVLHGWCWDAQRPHERLLLDVSINNEVVASVISSRFREDVRDRKFGDGYHGFHIILTKFLGLAPGGARVNLYERRSGHSFWHKIIGEFPLPEGLEGRIAACRVELDRLAWSPSLVEGGRGGRMAVIGAAFEKLNSKIQRVVPHSSYSTRWSTISGVVDDGCYGRQLEVLLTDTTT
jgi:hypothetical protein